MRAESGKAEDDRIALVLNRLDGGGIERLSLHLIEHFLGLGHQVDLVLGQCKGELLAHIPERSAVFEVAKYHPGFFFTGILRYLYRRRPRYILSAFDDVNCMIIMANRYAGSPAKVLVSNHNTLSSVRARSRGLNKLKYRLLPALMRYTYQKADVVVSVSRGVADDLAATLGFPRERIEVIYNPVITPVFQERLDAPLPPELQCIDPRPLVTFVGRLNPQKRTDHLVRAFAHVLQKQEARLLLIGEGPERSKLEELIRSLKLERAVILTGFLANPLPVIKASDVMVLSSAHEGLGNVLIEAMACGTQVVSTDCPHGPAEILENGRWGQLVPVDSESMLAEAILRSIKKEFWVEPNALKTRASEFSVDVAAKRYLELLGVQIN